MGPRARYENKEQPNSPRHPILKEDESTGFIKKLMRKEKKELQESLKTRAKTLTGKRTVQNRTNVLKTPARGMHSALKPWLHKTVHKRRRKSQN